MVFSTFLFDSYAYFLFLQILSSFLAPLLEVVDARILFHLLIRHAWPTRWYPSNKRLETPRCTVTHCYLPLPIPRLLPSLSAIFPAIAIAYVPSLVIESCESPSWALRSLMWVCESIDSEPSLAMSLGSPCYSTLALWVTHSAIQSPIAQPEWSM